MFSPFINRSDTFVVELSGRPCRIEQVDAEALLSGHLGEPYPGGHIRYSTPNKQSATSELLRVGVYALSESNTCNWICYDFDGKGHSDGQQLISPLETALATQANFNAQGLPSYLERSGGGEGWHLWAFFCEPIPGEDARNFAIQLAPDCAMLTNNQPANPLDNSGIEIFPKQENAKYGSSVWLPWFYGAPKDANQFYKLDSTDELVKYKPTQFDKIHPDTVKAIISSGYKPTKQAQYYKEWAEWTNDALARVPLESAYGRHLTGKSANGWLECRDPWSESGDKNPSAGVADQVHDVRRGTFHSFISGRSLSIFDFLIERGEAKDFHHAKEIIAQAANIPLPTFTKTRKTERPSDKIITNNTQIIDIIHAAWQAIHKQNDPPTLFARTGSLVRIAQTPEGLVLEELSPAAVSGILYRTTSWVKQNWKEKSQAYYYTASKPPKEIAVDLCEYPDPKLPEIEAIITTPQFNSQYKIITEPGYHEDDKLWYAPPGTLQIPKIPEEPPKNRVEKAINLLFNELLIDFPFVDVSDKANYLGALLLPFARKTIPGATPLHVLSAPTPGSGKTLLANLISVIATGRPCTAASFPSGEESIRKTITAELTKGQPIILFDNINQRIKSDALNTILTTEYWTDRILGQSKMITLPNHALWLISGNNPELSVEIARRSIRIYLDPCTDRPWERKGFKHEALVQWTRNNRTELITACLTIIQAWIAAGRPPGPQSIGSFEPWAKTIGGILENAGIHGFLDNRESLYESADSEGELWREFVAAWQLEYGDIAVHVSDLLMLANRDNLLGPIIRDGSARSQQTALGVELKKQHNRVYGENKVEKVTSAKAGTRKASYKLTNINEVLPF